MADFTGVTVQGGTMREIRIEQIPSTTFNLALLRGLAILADEARATDPSVPVIPSPPDLEEEGDFLRCAYDGNAPFVAGSDAVGSVLGSDAE